MIKMPKDVTYEKTRVQCDFGPKTMNYLDLINTEFELTTNGEALRKAVGFFGRILSIKKPGSKFFVQDPDGTITQIILY